MVWIPDDIWFAQQKGGKARGKRPAGVGAYVAGVHKGGGHKGGGHKGGGKAGWYPDQSEISMALQVISALGGSAAGLFKGGESKGKGQGKSGKQKLVVAQAGKKSLQADLPWKSRIAHAYGKEYKTPPTKDSVVYTTEKIEGEGFTCTLTCDKFSDEYTSQEVYPSKKLAEESAAMVALKAEFAAAYREAPAAMKRKGALGGAGTAAASQKAIVKTEGGGVKRKSVEDGMKNLDPKSRLNFGAMVLAERPITKEDLEYTMEEKNGSAVATLTLNFLDGKSFKGRPAPGFTKDSKKQAEQNAAEAVLKAYKRQIDQKVPEHQARKEAKEEAKKAEFAAKIEAKKAAGEIP